MHAEIDFNSPRLTALHPARCAHEVISTTTRVAGGSLLLITQAARVKTHPLPRGGTDLINRVKCD